MVYRASFRGIASHSLFILREQLFSKRFFRMGKHAILFRRLSSYLRSMNATTIVSYENHEFGKTRNSKPEID